MRKTRVYLRVSLKRYRSLALCACSMTPQRAPAKIDPAPVAFTSPCPPPDDLAEPALQKELEVWAALWIGAYGCEKSKRTALIEAWPR